jgi:hypothetical protein
MHASEAVIEQRQRVAQQHLAVDVARGNDASPQVLGREREHREPDE